MSLVGELRRIQICFVLWQNGADQNAVCVLLKTSMVLEVVYFEYYLRRRGKL